MSPFFAGGTFGEISFSRREGKKARQVRQSEKESLDLAPDRLLLRGNQGYGFASRNKSESN